MDMKGTFEDGKFYNIRKNGHTDFTWQGRCTKVYLDSYWTMDQYLQDFQVEGGDAETITYIDMGSEARDKDTWDTIEVKKSTEEYTLFTVSARIPHGSSPYFETFEGCNEVCGIKVPCGKRLLVKDVLMVDLKTGEYEVPEGYTVKEAQS